MSFKFNIIDDFLSPSDCEKLINYYRPKIKSSKVIGDSSLRTSSDSFVDIEQIIDVDVLEIVNKLKSQFSDISQLPVENQELMNIICYKPGEEFKPHFDAFSENILDIESLLGGQRVTTFIVCLRTAELGGETIFPNIQKSIKLNTSQLIYWQNTDLSGNIYNESFHAGLTPQSGEKWIMSCWVRERKFLPLGYHFVQELLSKISKEEIKNILKDI